MDKDEKVDDKIIMDGLNAEQNGVIVKEKDTLSDDGDENVDGTIVSKSAVVDSYDIQSSYL